jgi:hypothetical protein
MTTGYQPIEITRSSLRYALNRKPKKRSFLIRPKDVFGRKYTVWMDKNSEPPAPVGLISRNFSEPRECVIPDRFLGIPIIDETPIYSRMAIDFDGYITELKEALELWKRDANQWMRKLYKELGVQRAARGEYTEDVLELAGPMPERWELIELAKRGDKWCLGGQAERTPAVIEILGVAPTMRSPRRAQGGQRTQDMGERLESLAAQYLKDHPRFEDELDEDETLRPEQAYDRQQRELGVGMDADDPTIGDDEDSTLDGDDLDDDDESRGRPTSIGAPGHFDPPPAQPSQRKPPGRPGAPRDPKTGRLLPVKSAVKNG